MPSYSPGLLIGFPSHCIGDSFGGFIERAPVSTQSENYRTIEAMSKKAVRSKIEDVLRDYLLDIARAYAKATGYALTTVSRRFHGREYFLEEFAIGKTTITLRKYDEMVEAFESQWPRGVTFPQCTLVNRVG